ncbi:alpha-galactosidase [Flavilitoribacter nigricans]|uniref:Alpha-galactosidase n=1 Tax=Flavilitoribacter nigricans (strain ATCC 23147 / DSM 23189 / NBRC 102662 / NCIMB 1420 / SS-2) TaxID=1122177 RepID=A0A2D0N0U7_FLAN2|nr:alpha-galactosidase [Flavilitoribacter nigricans]PHN02115.1 alpha-galactosidase [Flavilitoribacter nigricans DSM 23189 = NBRC 102662]
MKKIIYLLAIAITLIALRACTSANSENLPVTPPTSEAVVLDKFANVAPTPPMGWNSFDAYDCRINEEEFRQVVDYMADELKDYGWEYAVIDYIWWHPEPGNWDTPRRFGHPNIRYKDNGEPLFPEYITMDEYGRLLPSVERFPSAADGQGFKPLGDYVHSRGLKFGIHIMRGIHRYAAFKDTPIKDSEYTAADIAEPWDTCKWCNHMYGVDPTQEAAAQAYYNSLFELYASWGVDYIKADDMMFQDYHKGEIAMMQEAIRNSGRPMVLSLSCGEAPLARADHLVDHSNMWRISADFWDEWDHLRHSFDLLNAWSAHREANHWPDADMLPIGRISLNGRPHGPERMSKFTEPEHYTLMSLFSIGRSPLMWGGDPLSTPQETVDRFLRNKEVLYVNQQSTDNRQVINHRGEAVWIATDPATGDRFLGLFNLKEETSRIEFNFEWEYLRDTYRIRDLWAGEDLGNYEGQFGVELPAHGAGLYRLTRVAEN